MASTVSLASPAVATSAAPAKRWVMWAIPTGLFLIAFFHRPAPGVIAKELMQTFAASGATIGMLSATYFYTYAGLMIPAGVLLDAFGVRRVVSLGSAVMGLGALAMAVAPSEALLFAGRLAVGAGATVTFVGALKVAGTWFAPSEFGTLTAVTATAGAMGAFLATAPLSWLVELVGWRGAFGVVAVLTLAGAALCYGVVRDAGGRDRASAAVRAPRLRDVAGGMLEVVRNGATWPPFFAFFFLYAAVGNMMLWIIPYLRDVYGLDRTDASMYAAATSLALLAAGPLTGWLSDRLRRRRMPFIGLALALAATWLAFVLTLGTLRLGAVSIVLFLMGAFGACFVLIWPLGRDVNPPRLAGVAIAVVNFGGFLGAAVTQGPLGVLLDARWEGTLVDGARVYPLHAYRAAFGVCAAFVIVAFLVGLLLRETPGSPAES
jgi:MFS family permease